MDIVPNLFSPIANLLSCYFGGDGVAMEPQSPSRVRPFRRRHWHSAPAFWTGKWSNWHSAPVFWTGKWSKSCEITPCQEIGGVGTQVDFATAKQKQNRAEFSAAPRVGVRDRRSGSKNPNATPVRHAATRRQKSDMILCNRLSSGSYFPPPVRQQRSRALRTASSADRPGL
jgi:hypothetical protein